MIKAWIFFLQKTEMTTKNTFCALTFTAWIAEEKKNDFLQSNKMEYWKDESDTFVYKQKSRLLSTKEIRLHQFYLMLISGVGDQLAFLNDDQKFEMP